MTRYSVQRFRAAVLHMYLHIAAMITIPLSALYFLLAATPDRGVVPFAFALFVLWLKWRTRHSSEESLRYAGWFVLMIMCLMLYGAYTSNESLHQEVWMMIFPIAFAPIVATRERLIWIVIGAVGLTSVMMLRPEPLTTISTFVFVIAYLTLGFITMMLVRHNEQNIERLAHLSIIDPLTRAYNRGYLKDVMVSEINRCRRSGQALTAIMLDIDYFKMFNDAYGHLYGDSVLEQVADALKRSAQRAGDYVFRYGGEEFCIITSGLNRDESMQFTEKLRCCILELNIENQRSPHRRLTASAGFWCASDLGEVTPSAMLLNADNALYRAKAAGRDLVVDFDEMTTTDAEMAQPQGVVI
ncbi:GGDEF domain-containing protein [Sideroxydans lithotrophicus]|uniref:diguanylate cyclase n=1 Tax=Sideroxydans lithotrophicus (strain ES-1) TaxID=580332 RepID=D5CNS8_SIDLE|nr:GGDEF domain-containing protein [Sideroxydans lithotrophicus]ADE12849.1 diguanylate cyclase [Sideroxydans lithotrophicus ES-1]